MTFANRGFALSNLILHQMDKAFLNNWLARLNQQYTDEQVPIERRPYQAVEDYRKEFDCWIDGFSSSTAEFIFEWFKARKPPHVDGVGVLFTGAFYYDTCFWPVCVPIIFGTVRIKLLSTLKTMPLPVRDALNSRSENMFELAGYGLDCLDYALNSSGILRTKNFRQKAEKFMRSGDKKLRGAISQLLFPEPNTNAILDLGMATEIFLKVVLIQEHGFDDKALKQQFGHDLSKAAAACFDATKMLDFKEIERCISIFPAVEKRYEGAEWSVTELWEAVKVAQASAAAVTRLYSGRDTRLQMFCQPVNFEAF